MEGPKIRKEENIKDKLLNIKTDGIREWRDKHQYNRCEPTPYRSLKILFDFYKLNENDYVVDFGSGRGRVVFYIHYRFNCHVRGIEANPLTFDEGIDNLHSYIYNLKDYNDRINFKFGTAETYNVRKKDNVFYFFNPFSIVIFKKVISNILKSAKKYHKKITLIIFYTIDEYIDFIRDHTPFELTMRIKTPHKTDPYQHFLIYEYEEKLESENLDVKA